MKLLLLFVIILAVPSLFFSTMAGASHHLQTTICKNTTLYSLTSHPQKEHMILCHPIGKTLEKQNQANIKLNAGIVLGQHTTSSKCPNNDTSFCEGFYFAKKYESATNTTTIKGIGDNDQPSTDYRQVSVFCMPTRLLPTPVWYKWCVW